jgi:hypothetical protein
MENWDWVKISQVGANLANILLAIATTIAGFIALKTYKKSARLEETKWIAGLYEKFFEKGDLKPVREILDCDDPISLDITKLIRDEPPEFTDYLNFFEFVAALKYSGQMTFKQVEQLFSYYINCLARREDVRDYVRRKDYQLLDALLDEYLKRKIDE